MLALFCLSALAITPKANALTCALSITDVNFGLVNAQNGTFADTQATVTYTCRTGLLELLSGTNVTLCASIGSGSGGNYNANPGGFRKMQNGGDVIPFNLYSDSGRSVVWGSSHQNNIGEFPPTITLFIPGSLFGTTASGSRPLYGRAFGQTGIDAGTYLNQFSTGQVPVDYGYSNQIPNCNRRFNGNGDTTASFVAQAQVQIQCTVNASDMDFGTTISLASSRQASSSVNVTCANGAPYQIGLSAGTSAGSTVNNRAMTRVGGSERASYQLYRNSARTEVWGVTLNNNTVSNVGTGQAQSHTVFGLVPAQATPPPGNYLDTVIATVTF